MLPYCTRINSNEKMMPAVYYLFWCRNGKMHVLDLRTSHVVQIDNACACLFLVDFRILHPPLALFWSVIDTRYNCSQQINHTKIHREKESSLLILRCGKIGAMKQSLKYREQENSKYIRTKVFNVGSWKASFLFQENSTPYYSRK